MFLIGLCGRSGSGKTAVSKFLSEKGVLTIDADKVCRQVYSSNHSCISELTARFGADIFADGKIDRKLLSKRAFKTPENISDLNNITHKYIVSEILAEAKTASESGRKYVLIDAPLFFESGLDKYCDSVIAVFATKKALFSRLKARDNIDASAANQRLNSQKDNTFLLNHCDAAIKNTGSREELRLRTYRAMLLVQIRLGIVHAQRERKKYVPVKKV